MESSKLNCNYIFSRNEKTKSVYCKALERWLSEKACFFCLMSGTNTKFDEIFDAIKNSSDHVVKFWEM